MNVALIVTSPLPDSTRHHAKQNVVFAVAARTAAKNFEPLAALLAQVGMTWEEPVKTGGKSENLKENMGKNGVNTIKTY